MLVLRSNLSLSLPDVLDTMVPAILKLYLIGTFVSALAVLHTLVDSIGALAHHQDQSYTWELEEMKAGGRLPPGRSVAKHVDL